MNIYDVEITGSIVIAAKTTKEAEEKALHLIRTGGLTYELVIDSSKVITNITEVPSNWSQDDLPFGADDDKTIAEYLARG